tara:strand:- start:67756 stop:70146 length:2391 start_codon:yes stop_codon:yes gene_type:complete
MLKNNLKIAWRNLKTNRLFSVINIVGLSIGLAITIVLFLFISFEKSYDAYHENKNDIYRVLVNTDDKLFANQVWCTSPAALTPALKSEAPDVKYATRMLKHNFGETAFVSVNNNNFLEKGLFWCDQDLFNIFNVEFVKGKANTAIVRPNTVVLSESTAQKYFGNGDPIGKIVKVDNDQELEVTGVYKDFPSNSTLDCNAIGSFSSTYFFKNPSWGNSSFETYLQLNENASIVSAEQQIQQVLDKNVDKEGQWFHFSLQPLEKIHLYSANYFNSYTSRIGDIKEIRNLSFLAILILLIACVNFMNLMTAKSQKRTKDVGINKTLGASTNSLVLRFYSETGLITFISLVLGVVLAIVIIPLFNAVVGQELDISLLLSSKFILGLFIIWLLTTILAGSYPAFYLSGFSPRSILNPSFKRGNNTVTIRKGLVVLQFAASVILIIGVLVIYQQLQFMQHKNLGYTPENVIAIATGGVKTTNASNTLVTELSALGSVSKVSRAQGFPGLEVSTRSLFKNENDENGINIQTNRSDGTITDVLQLKFLAGNGLPLIKQKTDTIVEVVLNKKAIDYLGYTPEEAIGKKIEMQLGANAFIIGVVDDFNFESLHRPIGAYAFHNHASEPKSYVLVRFQSSDMSSAMNQMQSVFEKIEPDAAFEYAFLDKSIEKLYEQDRKTAKISIVFCVLAIFVACLGLFGLAAFMAEQRKKEIGVRKVLGASVLGITRMLSIDFVKLVIISLLIAFPLAFWLMENWLEAFAYRITIHWFVFVIAGIIALGIALFTVSFQAIKASVANPVKSLRTE